MTKIDPILLGHNSFFGIDHLNRDRGDAKAQRFEETDRILDVLHSAHEAGVRAMMLSTHPRVPALCRILVREAPFAEEWRFYPLVPNIQKYVRGANRMGIVRIVQDTLGQAGLVDRLRLLWGGGRSLLTGDTRKALTTLVDVELAPFRGLRLGAVFLHDSLTDMALGLRFDPLLELFRGHIAARYGVPAGFTTKNLPLLRDRFEGRGDLLCMASFNSLGFGMNPSHETCAEAARRPGIRLVAMSTLAAGRLRPEEAYRYLGGFSAIRSVVVGVSQPHHLGETLSAIRRHVPVARGEERI